MVDAGSGPHEQPEGGQRDEGRLKGRAYFVNGERFDTDQHKLTVRKIVEDAGFTPAEEYRLTRDNGHHVFDEYDTEVPIHDGERFTVTFRGPTPTS